MAKSTLDNLTVVEMPNQYDACQKVLQLSIRRSKTFQDFKTVSMIVHRTHLSSCTYWNMGYMYVMKDVYTAHIWEEYGSRVAIAKNAEDDAPASSGSQPNRKREIGETASEKKKAGAAKKESEQTISNHFNYMKARVHTAIDGYVFHTEEVKEALNVYTMNEKVSNSGTHSGRKTGMSEASACAIVQPLWTKQRAGI